MIKTLETEREEKKAAAAKAKADEEAAAKKKDDVLNDSNAGSDKEEAVDKKDDAPADGDAGSKKDDDDDIPVVDEEPPIVVDLNADSDDDFSPIEIKDKVKKHIREHGLAKRIPEEIINEAVRWRLERNDCQNRGYILDGYPKNIEQADAVFIETPEAPEVKMEMDEDGNPIEPAGEDEGEKPDLTPKLRKNIYPESVISLRATEQQIRKRAKAANLNKTIGAGKW